MNIHNEISKDAIELYDRLPSEVINIIELEMMGWHLSMFANMPKNISSKQQDQWLEKQTLLGFKEQERLVLAAAKDLGLI